PAWRLEVTERVRQVKAKRSTTGVNAEEVAVNIPTRNEAPELGTSLDTVRCTRDNTPLVEAALTRVRRAKQEISSPAVPAVSGSTIKSSGANTGLVLDNQATARALDPAEETKAPELNRLAPETTRSESTFISSNVSVSAAKAVPRKTAYGARPFTESSSRAEAYPGVTEPLSPARRDLESSGASVEVLVDPLDEPIEEIDPVDYLEAEVRKVDQSIARELMVDESAPVFSQIIILVADLLTISISSIPFLALILVINGSLPDRTMLAGLGILVGALSVFYLSLTQSLCGKTFGMMFTNTRL